MSEICHLLSFKYLNLTFYFVAARNAFAIFIANFSFRKALAVHFETIYLRTLATLTWNASRREI